MIEAAQREICEIHELALTPTPANFQAIEKRFESLAELVSHTLTHPERVSDKPQLRVFLKQLPLEMARLQSLMGAAVTFNRQLQVIRALHFGAYERSGTVRSLESTPVARTVMHL